MDGRRYGGNLERAISLATALHDGQVDKAGQPYILHPLRVMLAQANEPARIAGVLHDVVEDCDIGRGDILALFGAEVHAAVDALTKRPGETYSDYVRRACANDIARAVKIADLRDNTDPARAPEFDPGRRERMAKYAWALDYLTRPEIKDAA